MSVLVGITNYGHGKDYVLPHFLEMLEECIAKSSIDVTVAWACDMPYKEQYRSLPGDIHIEMNPGHVYVEDMLIQARTAFRLVAQSGTQFDKLLYQGVDCLWQSREDFERVASRDVPVVSALTCARNDPNYAIARRFVSDDGEQEEVPDEELDIMSRLIVEPGSVDPLVPTGFPGADAVFFRRDTFHQGLENHTPWYQRVQEGRPNIECMEYTVLELQKQGFQAYVDASVKVWHVHENHAANMWPGITVPMESLSWK